MDLVIRPVEAIDYADVMRLVPRLLVGVDPSRPTVSVSAEDHWCGQADAWVGELMVDQRLKRDGRRRGHPDKGAPQGQSPRWPAIRVAS